MLYATVSEGISPDLGFKLRDLYNRVDPEGWWFINPGSFLAMFAVSAQGHERAARLVAEIERLRLVEPELSAIRLGEVEGQVDGVELRHDGKILSLPRGKLLNDAVAAAIR